MKTITWIESRFSCAHFYKQIAMSDSENLKIFGKCFTEYGHGHNYKLQVGFKGEANENLEQIVKGVVQKIDHEHLNFVIDEFKTTIPTTENISLYLLQKIKLEKTCEFEI